MTYTQQPDARVPHIFTFEGDAMEDEYDSVKTWCYEIFGTDYGDKRWIIEYTDDAKHIGVIEPDDALRLWMRWATPSAS